MPPQPGRETGAYGPCPPCLRRQTEEHKPCRGILEQALFLLDVKQNVFVPIAHQDYTIAALIIRQQRDTPKHIAREHFVAFNRNLAPLSFELDSLQEVFWLLNVLK